MKIKQLYYFLAIKEIVELFAEQELGSRCEINVEAVMNYVQSFDFALESMDKNNKEDIYQLVTDDIINGYPIWQLLNIPEWTKNMLVREYEFKKQQEIERLQKTYKCYTCKYFSESVHSIGVYQECNRPKEPPKRKYMNWNLHSRDREPFNPKKRCKYYEKVED